MLPIEHAAQSLGLRDDEWKPLGAGRLALDAEQTIDRIAAQDLEAGPLVLLCDIDDLSPGTLRLGAHLARELSDLDRAFSAVASDVAAGRVLPSLLEVGAAHNAIARSLDEHLMSGNRARLDPRRLSWPRCVSDVAPHRQLRRIVSGLDSEATLETIPREESFVTPAQSEIAALLTVAASPEDLMTRLERLIVGWRPNGEPIFAISVLPIEDLRRLLLPDILHPQWINEALPGGTLTVPRFQAGGASDLPFGGALALRAAQSIGGAVAVVGGGVPGVRNWFDVFVPACALQPRAFVIRTSVESIRELGAGDAHYDGADEWMSGLNVLQGRVTLLDRFSLPPILAVEASRSEYSAAESAVHVLESYGLRAIAVQRAGADDTHPPDMSALGAMVREWLHMDVFPHAFIVAGRSAREQTVDIANNIYGATCEWSAAAEAQLGLIERAGGGEAPVVIEPEGEWDAWTSSHALYGHFSPNALVTNVEWRAAAGYIKVTIRKAS